MVDDLIDLLVFLSLRIILSHHGIQEEIFQQHWTVLHNLFPSKLLEYLSFSYP